MWLDCFRIVWALLLEHKLRSLLTVGSITIGAFSIVLMSSLAESGLASLAAGLEAIGGARLLALWDKRDEDRPAHQTSYFRGLTQYDIRLLRTLPHIEGMTHIADMSRRELVSDTGEKLSVDVVAADADFFRFFHYAPAEGRVFDPTDEREHARVCVLGGETASRLKREGQPLLRRFVTVMGLRCRVIGRLKRVERWDVPLGWDWDHVVVLPMAALADHAARAVASNHWLLMHTDSPENNELMVRIINTLILNRHRGSRDFYLLNFHKSFIEQMMRLYRMMKLVVGLLAGIALVVGGVGVMNIMLVAVSERVQEIGIRKALGASSADIGRQFLLEAVLLSGLGGCLGVALGLCGGVCGGLIIQQLQPQWIIVLAETAAGVALGVSLFAGALFGYAPARRASLLEPAVAMRAGS